MSRHRLGTRPERICFVFEGQLPSKSNHRHSYGKHRQASTRKWKRIEEAQKTIGTLALKAWRDAGGSGSILKHALGKVCYVTIWCVNQRIDPNNAPKLVCDALEGICYENDKDVGSDAQPPVTDGEGPALVEIEVRWEKPGSGRERPKLAGAGV